MSGNSTRKVRVEAGGTGVVAHVGLHALGAFADRLGLGARLSDDHRPFGIHRRHTVDDRPIPLHVRGNPRVFLELLPPARMSATSRSGAAPEPSSAMAVVLREGRK